MSLALAPGDDVCRSPIFAIRDLLPDKPNGTTAPDGSHKDKPASLTLRPSSGVRSRRRCVASVVRPGWSRSLAEPELHMHHLIPIDELDKLTDIELIEVEARLRDLILTHDLTESDLRRCLASLSNAVFVRVMRTASLPSPTKAPR